MDRFVNRPVTAVSRHARVVVTVLALASFVGGFGVARRSAIPSSDRKVDLSNEGTIQSRSEQGDHPAPANTIPAVSGTHEDARQSLRDALKGDDPLVSAARVLASLGTMTAESFRRLAEAPDEFPTPEFTGFDEEFRTAYFAAIAKRWMELDPENALPAMQRVEEALEKKRQQPELLVAIARLRPEMALEKLPLKHKRGYFNPHARAALETLAGRDRNAARRFAEQLTDKKLRKEVEELIATGVAKSDPLAAVTMAANSNDENLYRVALQAAERIGPGMVRQVLQAASGRLGVYAITSEFVLKHSELAGEIPDIPGATGYLTADVLAAADHLSPEQREQLLSSYDTLPKGLRDSVAAAAVSSWARTEPQKAAEWALAHGNADDGLHPANTAAQQVFLRWINNDPDKALAWWRALPASALRDALGTNASTYLAENGQLDEALKMFRPHGIPMEPSGTSQTVSPTASISTTTRWVSTDQSAATYLAQFLAKSDPTAAGAWYANLPTSVATEAAAGVIVQAWYDRDPENLARWIETLPSGMPRDHAARAFIQRAAQQSPAAAAEWVETVADRELRQQAALWVMLPWTADDPARARQWIANLRGVDPEWQAYVLRRWK